MHPLLNNLRGLTAYLLAWVLAGAALAVGWAQQAPTEWVWLLGFLLPIALFTGLAALSTHAVCKAFPLRPAKWISGLSRRAAAAALLAFVVCGAAALWNATGALWDRDGFVSLSSAAWLAFGVLLTVMFALSALLHDALLAQQTFQLAAATEARSRLLAREVEIKSMRNQLDPHFLFNSLNAISSLIQLDPAAARAMTIDLAQFFRQTSGLGERERIRLDEELELVQHYLAIEQRRLGDKLRISLQVDADCREAWLPPLVLQPLAENAVKHGIRPRDLGGLIDIGASRTGARLVLRVSNPVDTHAPPDATALGQGLRHLRARLQLHYDEPADVQVESTADRFTVRVSLPWQT